MPHTSRARAAFVRAMAPALAALALAWAPRASMAQVLAGSVTVTPTAFSPDGDGVEDVVIVRYTLADSAAELSLVVLAADSTTAVDTLVAPAPSGVLGLQSAAWDGRDFTGTDVAEGLYLVRLFARPVSGADTTVTLPVTVDRTPPVVTIYGVSPAVYAPGVPGAPSVVSVTFHAGSVSPPSPGRVPDELQAEIVDPSGQAVPDADLAGRLAWSPAPAGDPPSITADADMTLAWDAQGQAGLTDGDYTIRVRVVDAAGYTAQGEAVATLDVTAPQIRFDDPVASSRIRTAPDSLRAHVVDASGVDTLRIRYTSGAPWIDIAPASVSGDTAFVREPLADSLSGDGSYTISLEAVDGVGRTATSSLTFTLDTSAPPPPVLDAFDGTWHSSTFTVTGTMPDIGEIESYARIRRNGVAIDSAFAAVTTEISVSIPLVPGLNVIDAVMVDAAGNESAPSNALRVTFDDSPGLFMPVPFRPGDRFTVALAQPAQSVTLRVYDTAGNLVNRFENRLAAARYDFAWDGSRRGGGAVRRGPLVAVATVREGSGSTRRLRRVFLFDPGR